MRDVPNGCSVMARKQKWWLKIHRKSLCQYLILLLYTEKQRGKEKNIWKKGKQSDYWFEIR